MSLQNNKPMLKGDDIDALDYKINNYITAISDKERMLLPGMDINTYLNQGRSVMHDIISGINTSLQLMRSLQVTEYCTRILDFPSGHGRVLRFLKAKFPKAEITAGDIIHEAVDYCVQTFDAKPLYSKTNLLELTVREQYNLIWCGSLITHLCEESTIELLDFFIKQLSRGGLLIFTVHGRSAISYLKRGIVDYNAGEPEEIVNAYKRTGYYYRKKPYQPGNSGTAFYSPSKMFEILEKYPDLKVVSYSEGGWGNHQDVVTCLKGDWLY